MSAVARAAVLPELTHVGALSAFQTIADRSASDCPRPLAEIPYRPNGLALSDTKLKFPQKCLVATKGSGFARGLFHEIRAALSLARKQAAVRRRAKRGCLPPLRSLLRRRAISGMAQAQASLKRSADVFRQVDLPDRIAGDLRRWRRNRQESEGLAGALIKGGARDLSPIIYAAAPGQIERRVGE
jgi:hypothetical protein